MRFSLAVAPALFFGFAAAAAVSNAEKRGVTDPTNPQNLINCPPNGGADGCHLETKVSAPTAVLRESTLTLPSATASASTTATRSTGTISGELSLRVLILGS